MRLLIMGPPGVGKGTQATGIAAHYGVPAISTGDIFRANVKNQTPLVRRSPGSWQRRHVPDVITNIVADRLTEADAAAGWLLDGIPAPSARWRPGRRRATARASTRYRSSPTPMCWSTGC